MIIHWIFIFLIVVAWGRMIVLLLRLFSFKLSIPIRSTKHGKSFTRILAGITTFALLLYIILYHDSLPEYVELLFVLSIPFIFEEWVLPMFTRNRALLGEQRLYITTRGIESYDLSQIFAVKIEPNHIRVFTHESSLAFQIFYRLDYSVNDWELLEDYFHKYHGEVTKHY